MPISEEDLIKLYHELFRFLFACVMHTDEFVADKSLPLPEYIADNFPAISGTLKTVDGKEIRDDYEDLIDMIEVFVTIMTPNTSRPMRMMQWTVVDTIQCTRCVKENGTPINEMISQGRSTVICLNRFLQAR